MEGLRHAAAAKAQWVIGPENGLTGLRYVEEIGTDWITPWPDRELSELTGFVQNRGLWLFLPHAERDAGTGKIYSCVSLIAPDAERIGSQRKINPPEPWYSPGDRITPLACDGVEVGVLICFDAFAEEPALEAKSKGARLLISPASFAPEPEYGYEPEPAWKRRTSATGLPLFVCNRSGVESCGFDFRQSKSAVIADGGILAEATADSSMVLLFDWDMDGMRLLTSGFERIEIL